MYSTHPVVENKTPNAIIAAGTVIFIGSVLLHHNHPNEVADKIVVIRTQEDAEGVAEEDEEVVVEDHNSQLEPL